MVVDGARVAQCLEQRVTPAKHSSNVRTAAAAAAAAAAALVVIPLVVISAPPEVGDELLVDWGWGLGLRLGLGFASPEVGLGLGIASPEVGDKLLVGLCLARPALTAHHHRVHGGRYSGEASEDPLGHLQG